MGSCGLAITATILNENPLSLLALVVTGIGFIGAGALIKTNEKTFGFTTAASMWLFSILESLSVLANMLSGSLYI